MDEKSLSSLGVTLVGLGGIGTPLLPVLPRLNFKSITLWDDDVVGSENLTNQLLWSAEDVGKPKAVAALQYLGRSGIENKGISYRYNGEPLFDSVVIAAVDSMESRRTIWRGIKESEGRVELFLDGRLSRNDPYFLQLFAIQTKDSETCKSYEDWLMDTDEFSSGRRNPDMVPAPIVLSGFMAVMILQWSRGERLPWQTVWTGVSMSLASFFNPITNEVL